MEKNSSHAKKLELCMTIDKCMYKLHLLKGLFLKAQEKGRRRSRNDLDGLDVVYYTASYQPGAGLGFSAGWVQFLSHHC